jgi:hypothetical protein
MSGLTFRHELDHTHGQHRIKYGGMEDFDLAQRVEVLSGAYAITVQRSSRRTVVMGHPATTAEEGYRKRRTTGDWTRRTGSSTGARARARSSRATGWTCRSWGRTARSK